MNGTEILTLVILGVLVAGVTWALGNLAKWLGFKKDSEIFEQAEKWISKAINSYKGELRGFIEDTASNITDKSELVDKVAQWMNENAGNIVESVGFEDEQQFRNWVASEVEEALEDIKHDIREDIIG